MSLQELISSAISSGMVRRFPAGLSALDPETQKPWPNIDAALEAMERSRTIAKRLRGPAIDRSARKRNRTTPEKDAMIRQMVREGLTLQQVANGLGRVSVSFVHQRCAKLGLKTRRCRRPKSVAEVSYYADVVT